MRKFILILLFFPLAVKSQVVADTTVYISNEGDTVKVVNYRTLGTTTIPTTTRLRDSIAVVRALIPDVTGFATTSAMNTALGLKQNSLGFTAVPNTLTVNSKALSGNISITASDVGLGSVDNTSDAGKPVSTAQQTALNLKANIASPTFTGTVGGITSTMVGLGSVNNTSDAAKPVSTAQQTALDLKANLASPTFTGTVALPNSTVTNAMLAGSIAYSKLSLTGAVLNADLAGSIAYSKLNLTGAILNADLAGSIAYSKLSLTGAVLNADLAGSIAYSKLSLTGAILNADLAGSIDLTTKVTGILPAANGGTGVNNSTRTLTISTNAGTIAFPTASTTQTFPIATSTIVGKVASVDIAARSTAVSATTIFTPTVSGMFRLNIFMKITATGTSPVAGPVTITYTDPDGSVAQSEVMLLANTSGAVVTTTVNNSTTTGTVSGSLVFQAKTGVAIQYAIAVSGTFAAGTYIAHLTLEAL